MNVIRLVADESDRPNGYLPFDPVDIFIDDQKLIDVLERIETPDAEAEGSPEIAGQYHSLSADTTFLPSQHFLGAPRPILAHETCVAILVCCCGCEGCWDFVCRMTFDADKVSWSDFRQVHRDWDYSELGTLVFDRKNYEEQFSPKMPSAAK